MYINYKAYMELEFGLKNAKFMSKALSDTIMSDEKIGIMCCMKGSTFL